MVVTPASCMISGVLYTLTTQASLMLMWFQYNYEVCLMLTVIVPQFITDLKSVRLDKTAFSGNLFISLPNIMSNLMCWIDFFMQPL